MNEILIENGTLVSRGLYGVGYVLVRGERIAQVGLGRFEGEFRGRRIDAAGKLVTPGVIDDHVHFRQPGMEQKGTIATESTAAVAGGVTSYMEMPNTSPAAATLDEVERKKEIAAADSLANYSFYLGATNDNIKEIRRADPRRVCGVKVFMGSSTGGMLVDNDSRLRAIFAESPLPVAAHCEDEAVIRANAAVFREKYGEGVKPGMHSLIRSEEACYRSSARAVELADRYGSRLHVLHVTTARELSLFDIKLLPDKKITCEGCIGHLWFSSEDYNTKGNLIKVNPSIKKPSNRDALQSALVSGRIDVVATDHAPHLPAEKQRPYWECPSGIPMVQHSLPVMLELSRMTGMWGPDDVVEKMCHAPAELFGVEERGFLRPGFYADIVIVDSNAPWTVSSENILSKCGWSPLEGTTFTHRVAQTIVNGHVVYDHGQVDAGRPGMELCFRR